MLGAGRRWNLWRAGLPTCLLRAYCVQHPRRGIIRPKYQNLRASIGNRSLDELTGVVANCWFVAYISTRWAPLHYTHACPTFNTVTRPRPDHDTTRPDQGRPDHTTITPLNSHTNHTRCLVPVFGTPTSHLRATLCSLSFCNLRFACFSHGTIPPYAARLVVLMCSCSPNP